MGSTMKMSASVRTATKPVATVATRVFGLILAKTDGNASSLAITRSSEAPAVMPDSEVKMPSASA